MGMFFDPNTVDRQPIANGAGYYTIEAVMRFEKMLREHFWSGLAKRISGRRDLLLDFDQMLSKLPFEGQYDGGLQEIAVRSIVGSVGRAHEFDASFRPRSEQVRQRWVQIARANLSGAALPPIEVSQVGAVYFVSDGNHRVSVARAFGQETIPAKVIVVRVPEEIAGQVDLESAAQNLERERFLRRTGLQDLRPGAIIEPTQPGFYMRLLEHIATHQWLLGEQRGQPVAWETAVLDWYERVYLPLTRTLREHHLLAAFPGRSEADLYVWVSERCWYLSQSAGQPVSFREAALTFADGSSDLLYGLLWQAGEPI